MRRFLSNQKHTNKEYRKRDVGQYVYETLRVFQQRESRAKMQLSRSEDISTLTRRNSGLLSLFSKGQLQNVIQTVTHTHARMRTQTPIRFLRPNVQGQTNCTFTLLQNLSDANMLIVAPLSHGIQIFAAHLWGCCHPPYTANPHALNPQVNSRDDTTVSLLYPKLEAEKNIGII